MPPRRRTPEMQFLGDRDEITQVAQFHFLINTQNESKSAVNSIGTRAVKRAMLTAF
jgi:hypothetical protein